MSEGAEPTPQRFAHYRVGTLPDGTPWKLGSGAMGVTYKAWDEKLRIPVALKVIAPGQMESAMTQALFLREARAAARVRHPNVANVIFLSDAPGNFFYAMELIEGEPLQEWLPRHRPLSPGFVCGLGGELARGLAAIHAQRLIHRDLKPANIMMVRAGSEPGSRIWTPKIIDFGLARSIEQAGQEEELAAAVTTGFRGTVLYASPEQCEESDDLDGRSDLYSLGCLLWEMLVGATPFRARTRRELMNLHVTAPVPVEKLAGLPAPLRAVLTRLLAKDRDERFPNAEALARELESLRDQLGNNQAATDEGLVETLVSAGPGTSLRSAQAPAPPSTATGLRRWFLPAGLAALLVVLALAAFAFLGRPVPPGQRAIAVLPFENVGGDKDNLFFADGLQDDVLSSLVKVGRLAVIGRSSVLPFRGVTGVEKLQEVGRALGATHLLEGRVRRLGQRVVLNVALMEVRSGRQIWVERYDRTLNDALTLQGDLAQEVAKELSASLSPDERARIATRPTNDSEAYLTYLRGRQAETKPGGTLANFQEAVRLYEQAIGYDPNFALARARLASTLTYIYLNAEPSDAVRARARAEAAEALRLQPELGQAHVAHALCFYRLDRNYEAALREMEQAARLQPNDLDVESTIAYIHRRQGRWTDAVARLERVLARDVRNPVAAEEVFIIRTQMRHWPEAERAGAKLLELVGQVPAVAMTVAWIPFWAREDLAPLQQSLQAIALLEDPDGAMTLARWDAACLARDFVAAEKAVAHSQATIVLGPYGVPYSRNYLFGALAVARGEPAAARPLLEAAREEYAAEVRLVPKSAFRRTQLALVHALLGEREAALNEAQQACALAPEKTDSVDGPTASAVLALVYARLGESGKAIDLLEHLLQTPAAGLQSFEASITRADLRKRWQWDMLRGEARFQQLVATAETR